MNEYAHIPPPPPPPPPGWVPHRGAPGLVPQLPAVATSGPYAAASAPRRRAHRGWVAVTSVVALGASIFGVAALAQGGDAASGSPLAAAIAETQAQKTARIDVTVEAPGLASPFVTTAEVDFENGVSHLTVDLAALAGLGDAPKELGTGPVEVLSKGSVVYVKVSGLGQLLGGDAKWIKIDASDMAGSAADSADGSVGATPDASALLDLLKEQADSFTEVGPENVRATDTTHYTAVIDVARLAQEHAAEAGDPSITSGIEELEGTTATFDVWIDGDDLVRKLVVHTDSSEGSATITVEFYDFGKPVDVTIPADADTIDLTALIGAR